MRARPQKSGVVYFYYDTGGKPRKEIPLGSDYILALKKYAELEIDAAPRWRGMLTFRYVADKWKLEVLPMLKPGTANQYRMSLKPLIMYFDNPPAPLHKIEPQHIKAFVRWRGKTSKVRANRDKAVFSLIWNWAREEGITALQNPCRGVKGFAERGRKDIYTEQPVYDAVYAQADEPLRDTMDLLYLTGQSPVDVRGAQDTDIRDGVLHFRRSKTGKKVRIETIDGLAEVLGRIAQRKAEYRRQNVVCALALLVDEQGQPLGKDAIRYRFDEARRKAAKGALKEQIERFQLRDLRAKAGTDKADKEGMDAAQKQLAHASITTTQRYVRDRLGDKVKPTK